MSIPVYSLAVEAEDALKLLAGTLELYKTHTGAHTYTQAT